MSTCDRNPSYMRGEGDTKPCYGCEKIGLRYLPPCEPGTVGSGSACKGLCPAGTIDAGWQGCKKQSYERQASMAMCQQSQEQTAMFCFPQCLNGATGLGPLCFGSCPPGTTSCMGALCLSNSETCSTRFQDMYDRVKSTVGEFLKQQPAQAMVNIGQIIGDSAP